MRCSSLGSMAAVGFWVYFLTECISGLGVLYFRCPPFFPPVGTSAGVCSRLTYDQVLRYTSCSAGVGAGAGACAGAVQVQFQVPVLPCGYFRGGLQCDQKARRPHFSQKTSPKRPHFE